MRARVELTNSSSEPIRIGSGITMDAAPASQQPWMAVDQGPAGRPEHAPRGHRARCRAPAAWRPPTAASSCSCLHETASRSGPLTNVTADGRSAARWSREMIGEGMDTGRPAGKWWVGPVKQKVGFMVMSDVALPAPGSTDAPPYRYTAALAADIEARWQDRWEREHTFEAPNPAGPLADPSRWPGRRQALRPRHVPLPLGRRPARRPPARATSPPTSTAASSA